MNVAPARTGSAERFDTRNSRTSSLSLVFFSTRPFVVIARTNETNNRSGSNVGTEPEDISETIRRRAAGDSGQMVYSMNPATNISVLVEEAQNRTFVPTKMLVNMWDWVGRTEKLCDNTADTSPTGAAVWKSRGDLSKAGVWDILSMASESQPATDKDVPSTSATLGCTVYDSRGRR